MSSPFGSMPVTTVTVASLSDPVRALLGGTKWGGAVGSGATVAFSFPSAGAVWYQDVRGDYSILNEPGSISADVAGGLDLSARNAVRAALAEWAAVANLDFYEIEENAGEVGDLRIAYTDIPGRTDWWGWTYSPESSWAPGGDVWINKTAPSTGWAAGSLDFFALLHELGHALGLKHSFDGMTRLPVAYDNNQYTMMSYTPHPHAYLGRDASGVDRYVEASTPMLYDIAAIQALYGANTLARTGDDVYRFDPAIPVLMTIWDAAGNDTISAADFTFGVSINLAPGQFSSLRVAPVVAAPNAYDGTNNLAIAYGAWIENAIGGSGNDTLLGNSRDNVLEGGAGNDLLNGFQGGDTASYASAASAVTVTLATTAAQATGGAGRDTLIAIENLRGSEFADRLTGNSAANVLDGGAGADTLSGGAGADTYHVDAAGDVIREARTGGNDTVVSSVDYTLGAWIENLQLESAEAINGIGNGLNNTLFAGAGDNVLFGGDGVDTVDYRHASAGVTVSLATDGPQATGGSGVDTLLAVERLSGSAHDDQLSGNAGNNLLSGGGGNDILTGGGGNDVFVFDTPLDAGGNIDLITDFVSAGYQAQVSITASTVHVSPLLKLLQTYLAGLASGVAATASGSDQIHLENAVFTALPVVGKLSAGAFASGFGLRQAVDANDRIIYDLEGGGLYYDADGSGAGASIQFAALEPGLELFCSDFRVI